MKWLWIFCLFLTAPAWGQSNFFYNRVIQNQINAQALNRQINGRMVYAAADHSLIEKKGAARIQSGKASLLFRPADSVYFRYTSSLSWDADEPQDQPGQVAYLRQYVALFEQGMRAEKLQPQNIADADAYAFKLAFEAWYGIPLPADELRKLREKYTLEYTQSAWIQGQDDAWRQTAYLGQAVMAMQAMEERKALRQSADPEDEKGIGKIRGYAKEVFGNDPRHVGVYRMLQGEARVVFERSEGVQLQPAQLMPAVRALIPANNETIAAGTLEKLLASFELEIKNRGANTGDLAWAQAVAFALTYEAVHQKTLSPKQLLSVYGEMRGDVLGSADFQALDDAALQSNYEFAGISAAALRQAMVRGEPAATVKGAGNELLTFLWSPRQLAHYRLTPDGFIKTEAAEKLQAALLSPHQDNSRTPSGSNLTYLWILGGLGGAAIAGWVIYKKQRLKTTG